MICFLTVGRFGFTEDSVPPGLVDRVVAHFVPGGLQLGRPTSFVVPWTRAELAELEQAAEERYQLDLDLSDHLTDEGLLCLQYTGVEVHVAYPVAALAAELFGASAGEHGEICDPASVRAQAERDAAENAQLRRVAQIPDGRERLRAVVEGAGFMPLWLARLTLAGVAPTIVPELVGLLDTPDEYLQLLAVGGLAQAGPAAVSALPQLTALMTATSDDLLASEIAIALAAMGPAAEPGLAAALDLEEKDCAREEALLALARLGSLPDSTRAKLEALARGAGELADMAKHALGESPIARRLARLRQAVSDAVPAARSHALVRRIEPGEVDEARVRLAAHLGDAPSQLALEGARRGRVADLTAWVSALPDAPGDWLAAVTAAALDARSAALLPRSAALTQAVAQTLREGTALERFEELLDAHDWMEIRGVDLGLLQSAVGACGASAEEHRQRLESIVKTLDSDDARSAFFLLLHEEAIPRVLDDRAGSRPGR